MTTPENPLIDPITEFANKIGIKTTAGWEALQVAVANTLLLDRKQQDYGPGNMNAFGLFGVVVRMTDKFERLKTLFSKKRNRVLNESMRDTFRDISNYATIAILLDTHRWPKE